MTAQNLFIDKIWKFYDITSCPRHVHHVSQMAWDKISPKISNTKDNRTRKMATYNDRGKTVQAENKRSPTSSRKFLPLLDYIYQLRVTGKEEILYFGSRNNALLH